MEPIDGDDTAFYVELTRQMLVLMDDDDDDETYARRNVKGGLKLQRGSVVYGGSGGGVVAAGDYFSWCEGGRRFEVPSWMERLWANAAGTGVFIPRVEAAAGKSRRRRRSKARKKNGNDGERMRSSAGYMIHG